MIEESEKWEAEAEVFCLSFLRVRGAFNKIAS